MFYVVAVLLPFLPFSFLLILLFRIVSLSGKLLVNSFPMVLPESLL
jgi:hypothetical protein